MCVHLSPICGVWYRHRGREETPQPELRGLDRFVGQAAARVRSPGQSAHRTEHLVNRGHAIGTVDDSEELRPRLVICKLVSQVRPRPEGAGATPEPLGCSRMFR